MADTGYNWGAWAFVQESASDWDGDALADNATDTSAPIDLDVKAAAELSLVFVEDNTGAIDGVCTVRVLGDIDGTNYENANSGAREFTVTPIQNSTVYRRFSVDPSMFGGCKIQVLNESGQELAVSVRIRTATIPAAS